MLPCKTEPSGVVYNINKSRPSNHQILCVTHIPTKKDGGQSWLKWPGIQWINPVKHYLVLLKFNVLASVISTAPTYKSNCNLNEPELSRPTQEKTHLLSIPRHLYTTFLQLNKPSTAFVEKNAKFFVSSGLLLVNSADRLCGSDSPVSEELST